MMIGKGMDAWRRAKAKVECLDIWKMEWQWQQATTTGNAASGSTTNARPTRSAEREPCIFCLLAGREMDVIKSQTSEFVLPCSNGLANTYFLFSEKASDVARKELIKKDSAENLEVLRYFLHDIHVELTDGQLTRI